jgi:hypothetical protein
MKKSKSAHYKIWRDVLRLLWSPFSGAWAEIQATANYPLTGTKKEIFVRALTAYFAPMTGAVRGFARAFREIWN